VAKTFVISKPNPLFRPELRKAPAHPMGARVLVREFPVGSKTEGGIDVAEIAKKRYMAGELIAVGDQAADKLYDLGCEIGDEVWYAQYAGLVEEWQHIVKDGNERGCLHDGSWDFVPKNDKAWTELVGEPNDNMQLRSCRSCTAIKLAERVLVLSVDDLILNVDVQARLERGDLTRMRGEDSEGRTRYYLVRSEKSNNDSFESIGKE
jgi:co-chaperonin GroES (HSP10)